MSETTAKGRRSSSSTLSKKRSTMSKTTTRSSRKPADASKSQMVYYFGQTRTEGDASHKQLLGGKGANLAEMTSIGLPVPCGFTITTQVCDQYYQAKNKLPAGLMDEVRKNVAVMERETGKQFGDDANPLLVSVRSGAAVSMPGMMNTILNLGLNDKSVQGLAKATDNQRFAYDAYRRLINMYGDVVMDIGHEHFEHAFDKIKKKYKVTEDTDVPAAGLAELVEAYKAVYKKHTKQSFPQDPIKQLELAIEAVFKSWMAPRAIKYRQVENIKGLLGTAVNVQSMVFGNMGDDCGTGVAFTRNPSTGENKFYGEFLVNAQGEDVVAGIRTPRPVAQMPKWNKQVHTQLLGIKNTLEKHYKDMQDIEFTVERRDASSCCRRATGKRTGAGGGAHRRARWPAKSLIDPKTAVPCVACRAHGPRRSSCCTGPSICFRQEVRNRGRQGAARLARRRQRRSWPLRPMKRSNERSMVRMCCWFARRPVPKMSMECTTQPESSPPPAG